MPVYEIVKELGVSLKLSPLLLSWELFCKMDEKFFIFFDFCILREEKLRPWFFLGASSEGSVSRFWRFAASAVRFLHLAAAARSGGHSGPQEGRQSCGHCCRDRPRLGRC